MKKILCIFILTFFSMVYSMNLITPDNSNIQYFGRFDLSDSQKAVFDWPGVYLQFNFNGTSCSAVLEGRNCFDLFVDGQKVSKVIMAEEKKSTIELVSGLKNSTHLLTLKKRSESNFAPSVFYGIILDKGKKLSSPPPVPLRKIEFIGDSYTAGFANEFKGRECSGNVDSAILATTNTNAAFGPLIAQKFDAQYQVNAYSGKGLVRNFNGIDKGKEFLYYYDKLLISSMNNTGKSSSVDFTSWKPDLIVIGIGINDFQADPPYADSAAFDSAYSVFLDHKRSINPGVKFICCATMIWPKNTLIPRIKSIVESQKARGKNDTFYFEFNTENNALYGHPGLDDHRAIAEKMIPLVSQVTGWKM